jgi:hypothetical protein
MDVYPDASSRILTSNMHTLVDMADDQRLADPFSPRKITNGFGKYNQYFYMPGRSSTHLTRRRRGLPQGRIISASLPTQEIIYGKERKVHLYQPPVTRPLPATLGLGRAGFLAPRPPA